MSAAQQQIAGARRPEHVGAARALRTALSIATLFLVACGDDGESGGPESTGAASVSPSGSGAGSASGPAPRLPDVAAAAGIEFVHTRGARGDKLLFETMGSGVAVADFDGDTRPDLLFLQSGTLPADEFSDDERAIAAHDTATSHALYRNLGDLRFEDVSAGSGLEQPCYAMGLAVGDIDADGDRDVWAACYGDDRLYRNRHADDDGLRFAEGARPAGLADRRWNIAGAFLDADLDGDLDLYVVGYLDMPLGSHHFCGPSPQLRTYCHVDSWDGLDDKLMLNDGAGVFADGSAAAGLVGTRGKGLAVAGGDYDDDGDTDLFVADDSDPNLLLRNDGGGRFTQVARQASVDVNGEGRTEACMGADFGDADGDGDLDLAVANFEQETNTLYRNDGGGFFSDASTRSGVGPASLTALGFGTLFVDIENDGDLDLYLANGHIDDNVAQITKGSAYAQADQLLLNDGRGRFLPADVDLGPSLHEPRVGRGVARGDLDGDGDHDLVVTNSDGAPWLLRNDLATGHRLVVVVAGPGGRADAEGARVVLTLGERRLVREVPVGGSYLSHSDTALIFGLGDAETYDGLELRLPGAEPLRFDGGAADRRLVFDGDGALLEQQPLPAPGAGS